MRAFSLLRPDAFRAVRKGKTVTATIPKTAFKKGEKRPGQGKRGPNKTTAQLKDMILGALEQSGGVDYLVERANDPKTASAFLTLVGKVLPMTVAGDPSNPLQAIVKIERVVVDPSSSTK